MDPFALYDTLPLSLRKNISRLEKDLLFSRHKANPALPDFLVIGAQKAGTSWLYENLKEVPGIFIPKKEIHFWDTPSFYRPLNYYTSYFSIEGNKVKGELTPDYCTLDKSRIRYIRKLIPSLKIIFITRDPVERTWSHAKMVFERKAELKELLSNKNEAFNFFDSEKVEIRSNYPAILDKWTEEFPTNQIFITDYSHLQEDPEAFFMNILDFLGVTFEKHGSFHPKKINKGREVIFPAAYRKYLHEKYSWMYPYLKERYSVPTEKWKSYSENP